MRLGSKLLLASTVLMLASTGCGNPEAEFASSEKGRELVGDARKKVNATILESFGTPEALVAWTTLPVDFGTFNGKVTDASSATLSGIKVLLEPVSPLAKDELLGQDNLNGAAIVWKSGPYQNAAYEKDGVTLPVHFRVGSYDAKSGTLTVTSSPRLDGESLQALSAGDEFEIVGHALQDGRRLYMRHCVHCHGVTGDGNGPTAPYLNPRPRDYRRGLYKFTSTLQPARATRDDLFRTIKLGLPGSYMPSFMLLPDYEVNAIVEYVLFLSLRGELEQQIITDVSYDWSNEVYDSRLEELEKKQEEAKDAGNEDTPDPDDQLDTELAAYLENDYPGLVEDVLGRIVSSWEAGLSGDEIILPEKSRFSERDAIVSWLKENSKLFAAGEVDPESFPDGLKRLQDAGASLESLSKIATPDSFDDEAVEHWVEGASRANGRSLFLGAKAKCASCHGATAQGNGPQTEDFQKDPVTNQEYKERGLFDVWGNRIKPRDLTRGIYRGGRRPLDIYRRVHAGVKGTPMAGFKTALSEDEMWDIVNYVLSIPYDGAAPKSDHAPVAGNGRNVASLGSEGSE